MYQHQSRTCLWLKLFLVVVVYIQIAYLQLVDVSTDLGNITGFVDDVNTYDEDGNKVSSMFVQYLGIPYAEPPVGELRFAKPVPKQPWNGTHNGTVYGPMCHQGNGQVPTGPSAIVGVEMSEDCLTLDIYIPYNSTATSGPLAVIIYLFGATGASRGFAGDALSVHGGVVVVVVNFRTHLMGYFSTGDSGAPGNYGLWDQQLAIRWVRDHIEDFGGDPRAISLVGFSMGGSNAILQALNPSNMGIIKRVVALSGTPFPTYKTNLFLQKPKGADFIESVKCLRETINETLKCLRSKTLEEINAALAAMPYSTTFTPVVDGDFILDEPETILTSNDTKFVQSREAFGEVDLMLGSTNQEGGTHVALMWSQLLNQHGDSFVVSKSDFSNIVVPTAMDLVFGENVPEAILQSVVFQYLNVKDSNDLTKLKYSVVDLSTDIDVAAPILKTAKFHAMTSTNRTFLYQFSANLSLQKSLTPSWLDGANHGDDVYFLFGFSKRNMDAWEQTKGFVPKASEIQTSRKWMTLITNFVKTGYPLLPSNLSEESLVWPPFNNVTSPYAEITHSSISDKQYFREPQMTFWTQIVPSLLSLTQPSEDYVTCNSECEPVTMYGRFFNIDLNLAENIIISFIIMSACLLLALLMICSFSVAKEHSVVYKLKKESFDSL